jgi:hypothetical protein
MQYYAVLLFSGMNIGSRFAEKRVRQVFFSLRCERGQGVQPYLCTTMESIVHTKRRLPRDGTRTKEQLTLIVICLKASQLPLHRHSGEWCLLAFQSHTSRPPALFHCMSLDTARYRAIIRKENTLNNKDIHSRANLTSCDLAFSEKRRQPSSHTEKRNSNSSLFA